MKPFDDVAWIELRRVDLNVSARGARMINPN
jgi:hypothetical protein